MNNKILGAIVIVLVLAGVGILAFNWRMIASPQTTTTRTTGSAPKKIKVPDNGCYLGAWAGYDDITQFENMIGKKLAMRNVYYAWGYGFPSKALTAIVKPGMILVLSGLLRCITPLPEEQISPSDSRI